MFDIHIDDNSDLVLRALRDQMSDVLDEIGREAKDAAVDRIVKDGLVDTGDLRDSIDYKVDESEMCVYVGTNDDAAEFTEFGTGKYTKKHANAPYGNKAYHWLKGSVRKNRKKYQQAIKEAGEE